MTTGAAKTPMTPPYADRRHFYRSRLVANHSFKLAPLVADRRQRVEQVPSATGLAGRACRSPAPRASMQRANAGGRS